MAQVGNAIGNFTLLRFVASALDHGGIAIGAGTS